jgi:PBP1b-binding outer membrane lipoprotein LpoB
MKSKLTIIILIMILASCKKETESKTELPKSDFNLKTDLTDFKKKMTDLDTIKVFFDHSVCTYEGYERIEITKQSDSIKVRTEFKELTFSENKNPEWNLVYEKKISETDTIWQFEKFIERNANRKTSDKENRGILIIENKKDTIQFYTDGLVDLNHFLEDYYLTMKKIYPENKNGIYGYELAEE